LKHDKESTYHQLCPILNHHFKISFNSSPKTSAKLVNPAHPTKVKRSSVDMVGLSRWFDNGINSDILDRHLRTGFQLTADARRHSQTVFFPWPTWPGKTCMPCGQTGFKKVLLFSIGKY